MCAAAYAQTDSSPSFEAASVKLNNSGSTNNSSHDTEGQLTITNLPLDRLIQRAFEVGPAEVIGPDWLGVVRVDIAAKYPAKTSDDDRTRMLRKLLEERFKLSAHRENRQLPGYVLVVAKSGLKLKPQEECQQGANHSGGRIETLSVKCTSMDLLAQLASRYMGAVVENKTGVEGVYNFDLRWTNQEMKDSEPVPNLPDALQEVVGVRLLPQKVTVEVVIVDHMDKSPVEN
jgi:uncharacterized protein (TIGR03435 family)